MKTNYNYSNLLTRSKNRKAHILPNAHYIADRSDSADMTAMPSSLCTKHGRLAQATTCKATTCAMYK